MRKRKLHRNKTNRKINKYLLSFIILAISFLSLFLLLPRNSINKLVLLQPGSRNGDLSLLILDFKHREVVNLIIPGNTELEVAGNLGKRKILTLWKLARDERKDGNLVARTISSNFFFPIDGWVERSIFSQESKLTNRIVFFAGGIKSSFSLGERYRILYFLIKNKNIVNKNLEDTNLIKKEVIDGNDSIFVLTGDLSTQVLSFFADETFLKNSYKIMIRRPNSLDHKAKIFGKTIETLGVKPAYSIIDKADFICKLKGTDTYLIDKLSHIFPCTKSSENAGVFDAELILGNEIDGEF